MSGGAPADDWLPLDAAEDAAQRAWLVERVRASARSGSPPRVLDLGAGDGRLAVPLADAGAIVVAVDRDPDARAALAARGHPNLRVEDADVAAEPETLAALLGSERVDLALCLGNTLLLFDVVETLALLVAVRPLLRPGGRLAIDDLCGDLWRDVAEGAWQSGVSEDGTMQLVWATGDNTIALRTGEELDPDSWAVREGDRRLHLYSTSELRLLAVAAGWQAPRSIESAHLLLFEPSPEPTLAGRLKRMAARSDPGP